MGRLVRGHASRWDDEEGMTLVEVMAAIFVLSVAVLAVASVASASLLSVRVSRDRDRATAAASAAIERARAFDYGVVSLADTAAQRTALAADSTFVITSGTYGSVTCTPTNPCFDHDGPGPESPELLDITANGAVDPYRCPAGTPASGCWGVAFEGKITLRTFVTRYTGPGEVARRITSVASWSDDGEVREVRESTIIAQAHRGLPVPNFDVDGELNLSVTRTAPPATSEVCFDHTFRNLGARDSYDMFVTNQDTVYGSGGAADHIVVQSSSGAWEVRAWLGDGALSSDSDAQMLDDGTEVPVDDHLESQDPVANDAEVPLQTCFTVPTSGTADETFVAEFRSEFDPNVTRTVTYRIVVTQFTLELYLHDVDPTTSHDRAGPAAANEMNESAPTWGAGGGEKPQDYDQNLDPNDHPGIHLARDPSGYAGVWDHQFINPVLLGRDMSITFWSSHNDALRTGSGRTDKMIGYKVVFERVNTADGVVGGPRDREIGEVSVSNLHPVNQSWMSYTATLNLTTTIDFDANEFLRVSLTCDAASQDDCHVLYDHTTYPSRTVVKSP